MDYLYSRNPRTGGLMRHVTAAIVTQDTRLLLHCSSGLINQEEYAGLSRIRQGSESEVESLQQLLGEECFASSEVTLLHQETFAITSSRRTTDEVQADQEYWSIYGLHLSDNDVNLYKHSMNQEWIENDALTTITIQKPWPRILQRLHYLLE